MKKIYVCSPLNAPTQKGIRENMLKAREYIRIIEDSFPGVKCYAPHAWLPEMLDDNDTADRKLALDFGIQMLRKCEALFICGNRISDGMANEIKLANNWGISVYTFGTDPMLVFDRLPDFRGQVFPSSEYDYRNNKH